MRKLEPIKLAELSVDFELRHAQKLMLNMTRESIRKGNKQIIQHLPCGGGKTVYAGAVFYKTLQKDPTAQCIFTVPRIILAEQAKAEFEEFYGFDCSIIQGDILPDLSKHIQIATIQTLANRLKSDNPRTWNAFNSMPVKVVFVDEAQLMFEGVELIRDAYNPLMLGGTGTPFSKGLGVFWQDMVRPVPMAAQIKDGTLCDYDVVSCTPIDRSALGMTSTGEYNSVDVTGETGAIIGDVFQAWKNSPAMQSGPFIGFCKTIASCVAMTEHFTKRGANVAFVHSKMSDTDVLNTMRAFDDGMYDGLWSVDKLTIGYNNPKIGNMIDCSPRAPSKFDPNIPNSANNYVQAPSRILRSHPGKDLATVHDHVLNYATYGPYELIELLFPVLDDGKKKERKLTLEEKRERVRVECGTCGTMFKGKTCHLCGDEPVKPTQWVDGAKLDFINGEMVELRGGGKEPPAKKPKATKAEKSRTYGMLLNYARGKGYKDGWASNQYRVKYKVWPSGLNANANTPPDEGLLSWILSQQIRYAKRKVG